MDQGLRVDPEDNHGLLRGHQHADEDTIRRRTGGTDEVLFDTHLTQPLPKQMAHE